MVTTMQLYKSLPVAEHFLVALFNDDFTNLDDYDYQMLKEWCESLPETVMFEVVKEEDGLGLHEAARYLNFCEDSVTGTLATCALINIYTPVTVH
jgi:hypothetical protein